MLLAALVFAGCSTHRDDDDERGLILVLGRTGYGPREFSYPRAIAIDPDDHVYIVDKTGRIQRYSPDGEWLADWKTPQIEAGKPTGLGIGPDGSIWVADTHYARVLVYNARGDLLHEFGDYGESCGQFHLPTDVAVTKDGACYVGEYGGNDRVSRYSASGECIGAFGGPDDSQFQLARPQGIHIARDGTLWIADSRNHRMLQLSAQGALLSSFGSMGTGPGELRFPYGVDQLSDGSLVVAEYGNNRVQRFNEAGKSMGTWGSPGRDRGRLAYPWAVAVDSRDRVWIVDSGNNRVQVIDGADPRTWRRQ